MALLIGDLARGTVTRAPAEGSFQSLAWTPDGIRIALDFSATLQDLGRLNWLSADGSTPPEPLTSETARQSEIPTSFSSDGSLLLFDMMSLATPGTSDTGWDIFVLPLKGPRRAYPFLQTRFDEHSARFSPDGRWVAYHSNESGRIEVFVRPFPGPGPKSQISTAGGAWPCWSQNGRELCYRDGDKIMSVDVETKSTFHASRPRVLFEGQFLESYDVASNGKRFLMIKRDPCRIWPRTCERRPELVRGSETSCPLERSELSASDCGLRRFKVIHQLVIRGRQTRSIDRRHERSSHVRPPISHLAQRRCGHQAALAGPEPRRGIRMWGHPHVDYP